jgi:hypothetical protein
MNIEEPSFDIYPGNKNGFLDLCSSEFGNVNGNSLKEIIKKDENFKSNLRLFLKEIGHKINLPKNIKTCQNFINYNFSEICQTKKHPKSV